MVCRGDVERSREQQPLISIRTEGNSQTLAREGRRPRPPMGKVKTKFGAGAEERAEGDSSKAKWNAPRAWRATELIMVIHCTKAISNRLDLVLLLAPEAFGRENKVNEKHNYSSL